MPDFVISGAPVTGIIMMSQATSLAHATKLIFIVRHLNTQRSVKYF